jgi:hypothetical protein
MAASVTNAAAVRLAAKWLLPLPRLADEHGQAAPDNKEDADEIDVGSHGRPAPRGRVRPGARGTWPSYAAEERTATRSSTRTGGACRATTRNLKRAPSATPAGTETRTG